MLFLNIDLGNHGRIRKNISSVIWSRVHSNDGDGDGDGRDDDDDNDDGNDDMNKYIR